MCVVSMVADHYQNKWILDDSWKDLFPKGTASPISEVTRDEFEALRKEVLELKELLKKAKKYDEDNNQPDCEDEDKLELIRRVAKAVGVDLSDVI